MSTDTTTATEEPLFNVIAKGDGGHESHDLTRAEAMAEQTKLRGTGRFRRVWMQQQKP